MSIVRSAAAQAVREVRNRVADFRSGADLGSPAAGPLPAFLIVGAMKAGTTSLAGNLKAHPDLFLPRREVRFFDQHWHEGVDWYRDHFRDGVGKVCGEKTPEYMRTHRSMSRIKRVVPDATIIVLLREPVARLMSEINHRIQSGTLPAAVRIDGAYIRRYVLGEPLRGRRMLDRGFYAKLIRENVLSNFPRERVLIQVTDDAAGSIERDRLRAARLEGQLTGEDESDHTARMLDEICDFLGVERFAPTESFTFSGVRIHGANETVEARKLLYDRYAEPNRRLFDLLGREIATWREDVAVRTSG